MKQFYFSLFLVLISSSLINSDPTDCVKEVMLVIKEAKGIYKSAKTIPRNDK